LREEYLETGPCEILFAQRRKDAKARERPQRRRRHGCNSRRLICLEVEAY
jgi:hypothetical protein